MQSGKNVSAAIFRKTALRNRQRFLYGLSLILKTILETLYALATYLHISIDAIFSNQKTNPDSTMQQIMAELNSCPEEQKQLALSTLRGLLDGFKNLS